MANGKRLEKLSKLKINNDLFKAKCKPDCLNKGVGPMTLVGSLVPEDPWKKCETDEKGSDKN